ncbi:hypothetical protein B0H19DRAFT_1070780 [Mycena capillaripes]|nr:hypothetical protein B0H19DRAFT_1070780 [Mycena capillaripes]
MLSAQELRARIETLSTEIDLQKEALKNLEREKSLAQRQLNNVLDPIARLPLEISSEIFLRCLPAFPEHGAVHVLGKLFLNICNTWTDIALSTPALWGTINIIFPCAEGFQKVLPIWLQRAGNRPLSISLRGPGEFDQGVMGIIWHHGQQLKHLEMCYEKERGEASDDESDDIIDLLGGMSPGPLPLLKTLTIRGFTELEDGQGYSGLQILKLLRSAPNLMECVFECVCPMYGIDSEPDEMLVLPALRRLIFGGHGKPHPSDDDILNCLSLPRLEALSVTMWSVSGHNLLSFLKRSLPPLRELVLGEWVPHLDFIRLAECLRLVPALTHLEIWGLGSPFLNELFAALAESSSPIISNLRSLTIQRCSPAIPNSTWKTLLRALAGRHTELHIVHIIMRAGAVKPTTPDILAGFGELVADGMQLFIGPTEKNFLSG